MNSVNGRQKIFEKIFKEHLKIDTYSKSIESLFSPRLLNKINYKPYYQRNYVWDRNKATYFIESILLGTEIPPLIFFNNNTQIEVIDGRQRFETIQRFIEGNLTLTAKGLYILKQLKKCSFNDLSKKDRSIIETFFDAKLRIIEFGLVNEPPLDKHLEDRVKKEIFSRYNSGITPLRKAEIDNAIYDDDALSNLFKNYLEDNPHIKLGIYDTFLPVQKNIDSPPIASIMSFIRRFLVLPLFPIRHFARGTSRTDILTKLYQKFSDDSIDNESEVINEFFKKIAFLKMVFENSLSNDLSTNRLALESFLWGFGVLDLEEIPYNLSSTLVDSISKFIHENIEKYTEVDSAFYKEVMTRYLTTADFLSDTFKADFSIYIQVNDETREQLKELQKPDDTITRLSELENLRLNKPEPSRNSIDDIVRIMQRRRFLVRPSYQRKEVINQSKASSIIESILLGITLPTIFLFKRKDGISEVIDGQQRILTLLGFIGAEYINEKDEPVHSKNNKFPLRQLRILKEIEKKHFFELDQVQQDKIYDFQLYVVEIDEGQNPNFDPIDLFIRLNDKPYPIREHSFEMWNSWVDVDIVQTIKNLSNKHRPWLYLRPLRGINDRDRMENEELLLSLAFLDYMDSNEPTRKSLDIYQKTERINARLSNKAYISTVLQHVTEGQESKNIEFKESIKKVKSFVQKLKYVILDCDKTKDELYDYLKNELDLLFKANKETRYFKRTKQDFYIIWYLLSKINLEMVKYHRLEMKERLFNIFNYMKNIPEEAWLNNQGYNNFINLCDSFVNQYSIEHRRLTLSENEKHELIKSQQNLSPLSSSPIFLGDDIEVDHTIALAIGGSDSLENVTVVHKDENRTKGSKY